MAEDKENKLIMTNKKNLKWAILMMAACLLAACSSNDNEVETPQTNRLTFGVTVNEASAPTSRSAEWEYEDTYTGGKTLALKWDETNGISVFHYKATDPASWHASAYKGSLAVNKDSQQKIVSVTIADWAENKDGLAAFFPYNAAYSFTEGKISEIEMPQNFSQSGKDATHLSNNMYMYGTLPCGTPGTPDIPVSTIMTLHHIPTVLRSLIINKGDAPRVIKKVEIVASIGFISKLDVQYTKQTEGNDFDVTINKEAVAGTIAVTCDATTQPGWNTLVATGAADKAGDAPKADRLMAYALCFPTDTEQTYTFKVTATDADGTNETTYTSNVIDSSRLTDGAFKSGYYYTFELLLDDELTATLKEVTDMPGWDNETEL